MIGYKLMRKRRDGTYGSLFIDRARRLVPGIVYPEQDVKTKGYAHRPGWHVCERPYAPHLSTNGRVWCKVSFAHKDTVIRPECQGGIWYLGRDMEIIEEVQ